MGSIFRGLLGKSILVVLALSAALALFIICNGASGWDLSMQVTLLKVTATMIGVTVSLILMLLCALTLGTRYTVVGLAGVAVQFIGLSIMLWQFWTDTLGPFMGTPSTSSKSTQSRQDKIDSLEGLNSPAADAGSASASDPRQAMAFLIIVVIIIAALPLINIILFAGYNRGSAIEAAAIITATMILLWAATVGMTFAGLGSESAVKLLSIVSIVTVTGIVGTAVASGTMGLRPEPKKRPAQRRIVFEQSEEMAREQAFRKSLEPDQKR